MKALVARRHESYRLAAWQAWHGALWQRIDQRKFPKLKDAIRLSVERPRRQTPDQQWAAMKQIYLVYGGDPKALETLQ